MYEEWETFCIPEYCHKCVRYDAYLYNLEDEKFLEIVFDAPNDFCSDYEVHLGFVAIAINFLNKIFKKVNHFQDL